MELTRFALEGVCRLDLPVFRDRRGSFVKPFSRDSFRELDPTFTPAEEFYSVSARGVIRGLHFQVPPADHAKLVYCLHGRLLDLVLDLRRSSPTYGRTLALRLDADRPAALYIPRGCAHGFLSLEDDTILVYQTTSVYRPDCDAGVRWNSVDYAWPCVEPIVSERDQALPPLTDFVSPFA